ncbi:MAG: DUF1624 domain-containing protein [Chitinophagaceae bacterium]|nr:DUF1624 domain-containing protein [Chitinophagaceae bacterium]MCW5927740.1 DUF1624 domain-containing protein [Chitinophagaceae bacterium]
MKTAMRTDTTGYRLLSIDIVRGFVMVLMALDHCRDLLHVDTFADPLNFDTTTTSLFLTRWITHLCAPSFVFLSGVSAFLSTQKHGAGNGTFLVKRGLWLILLECTVVNFGIWFDIHFSVLLLQVIAAIGFGLVILGLLVRWRVNSNILLIAGIVLIVFHQLVPALLTGDGPQKILFHLFQPGLIPLSGDHTLLLGYPPLPWLGIILAGYGCGRFFQQQEAVRKKKFLQIVFILLGCFLVLRITDVYGDLLSWMKQSSLKFTVLSFVNVSKYPPSLQFAALMLGIMFALLYLAEKYGSVLTRFFNLYGSVPLFFYILHWYFLHLLMFVVLFFQGFGISDFSFGFNFPPYRYFRATVPG